MNQSECGSQWDSIRGVELWCFRHKRLPIYKEIQRTKRTRNRNSYRNSHLKLRFCAAKCDCWIEQDNSSKIVINCLAFAELKKLEKKRELAEIRRNAKIRSQKKTNEKDTQRQKWRKLKLRTMTNCFSSSEDSKDDPEFRAARSRGCTDVFWLVLYTTFWLFMVSENGISVVFLGLSVKFNKIS